MKIQKLQELIVAAMKNRNTEQLNLLRLITSESMQLSQKTRKDKTPTEDEILSTIKKMKQNALLCNNQVEADLLESYLPKSLSENETKELVKELIENNNLPNKSNFGQIMKLLPNNVDKKFVSTYLQIILK